MNKEIFNNIKAAITQDDMLLKRDVPMLCKTMREVHNIMLPNKRKNIINRIVSYVEGWFN